MNASYRERQRYARYARFILRNKRRKMNAQRLEELREARRAAKGAANLPIFRSGDVPRIELAPQARIENLMPEIKLLLKAFGHPEALVTDESLVGHMLSDGKKLVGIRRKLKIPMATTDYIFAVAERLLARQKRTRRQGSSERVA